MLLRYCGFSEVQLSKLPHLGRAATLSRLPMSQISPKLKSYIKAPVYGLEMFRTLLDSAVALNSHIDMAGNEAANIRLFEVTGVGSCLLTDWKENLHELFEIDREIVAYKSVEECIEKGRWLLENPREREMIAAAGQARTLREHTFDQRAAQLAVVLRRIVCSKSNGD